MKLISISFLNIILFSGIIFSQPSVEWIQQYNGPANSFDIVSEMLLDSAGNVYVYGSCVGIGTLTDFALIKYNSNGAEVWKRTYNSPANSADQISGAFLDNSGNSFVTGFITDSLNKITTAKYNPNGDLIWMNTFQLPNYGNGFGQKITLDNTGNIIVSGFIRNPQSNNDIIVIKYSAGGIMLWYRIYDFGREDINTDVKVDGSNNILIAGDCQGPSADYNISVLKYDASGAFKWAHHFNGTAGSDDKSAAIALDGNDNVYICGSINNFSSSLDYFCSKINSQGIYQWARFQNGAANNFDIVYAMAIDSTDNIYLTGYSRNADSAGTEDIMTTKINTNGSIIWNKVFNGAANGTDQGNAVAVDMSGNVYVGGASDRGNVQLSYALLKYNSSGTFQWLKSYHLSNYSEDFIYKVRLDKSNNILVTGIALDSLTDFDIVTIKYNQTVGISSFNNFIPGNFYLKQNYPNPFNPSTNLEFGISPALPSGRDLGFVTLKVCNSIGQEIATLVNENKSPGSYSVDFNGSNLPSGIYYYSLMVDGNLIDTKKMLLVK